MRRNYDQSFPSPGKRGLTVQEAGDERGGVLLRTRVGVFFPIMLCTGILALEIAYFLGTERNLSALMGAIVVVIAVLAVASLSWRRTVTRVVLTRHHCFMHLIGVPMEVACSDALHALVIPAGNLVQLALIRVGKAGQRPRTLLLWWNPGSRRQDRGARRFLNALEGVCEVRYLSRIPFARRKDKKRRLG
jgi:hypothetical protein